MAKKYPIKLQEEIMLVLFKDTVESLEVEESKEECFDRLDSIIKQAREELKGTSAKRNIGARGYTLLHLITVACKSVESEESLEAYLNRLREALETKMKEVVADIKVENLHAKPSVGFPLLHSKEVGLFCARDRKDKKLVEYSKVWTDHLLECRRFIEDAMIPRMPMAQNKHGKWIPRARVFYVKRVGNRLYKIIKEWCDKMNAEQKVEPEPVTEELSDNPEPEPVTEELPDDPEPEPDTEKPQVEPEPVATKAEPTDEDMKQTIFEDKFKPKKGGIVKDQITFNDVLYDLLPPEERNRIYKEKKEKAREELYASWHVEEEPYDPEIHCNVKINGKWLTDEQWLAMRVEKFNKSLEECGRS